MIKLLKIVLFKNDEWHLLKKLIFDSVQVNKNAAKQAIIKNEQTKPLHPVHNKYIKKTKQVNK